jgi:hypothetical protein
MQEDFDGSARRSSWRRNGIKASIFLVLLVGTVLGITQAIILLALYAIIIIPL